MSSSDDLRSQLARSMALTTALGLDMACVLVASVLIGTFVDSRFGTGPIGLVMGIVLGLAGGGYSAYILIRRMLQ